VLVAIDGRSGAGKSTFADELAKTIGQQERPVVRSTTDSFHRPRAERLRLGPASAEGYVADSHQLDLLACELLEPFARGASSVLVAAFDEPSDAPAPVSVDVGESAVLIFDGLFLQRPELAPFWHLTVYLEADDRIDQRWLDYLLSGLPVEASARAAAIDERLGQARWPRYRNGWSRYAEQMKPAERASMVIDNNNFELPRIVRN